MLSARLMLGLMLLFIMLLSMGVYSIDKCSELSKRIEAVRHSHDQAARDIAQLRRSCVAMTDALLGRMESEARSQIDFDQASTIFGVVLKQEYWRPGKSAEEAALNAQLQKAFNAYDENAEAFWRGTGAPKGAGGLGASTGQLLDLVEKLSAAHEQTLESNAHESSADINTTILFICFLIIIALTATVLAWMGLNHGLLSPLRSLTASIREVGEGNLDQKVPVLDKYELGQLATSFNKMAEQLKEYRAHTSVELMRLNLTIRATLASFPDPIFVLNSEGAVEFRNPEADQLAVQLLFSGVTRLPQEGRRQSRARPRHRPGLPAHPFPARPSNFTSTARTAISCPGSFCCATRTGKPSAWP
jgi:NtrC-family two-component system sensor histidine kinase KinB